MASITAYKDGWRAQLSVGGIRESSCFTHKFEAESWANRRETELKILKQAVANAKRLTAGKHKFLESAGIYSEDELVGTSIPTPETSGIYFLIQNGSVVYVGQSNNVHRRISEHLTSKCFDRVNVIECPASELDRVEALYIRRLKPILNAVGKSGVDEFDLQSELMCQAL